MGFAVYLKIARQKGKLVEAARDDLYNWIEEMGGYDKMYFAWKLAGQMTVIYPESEGDREYFGDLWPHDGEAMVFHHDCPWLWHLPPEVMTKGRECFEHHGVIEIWWSIVKEDSTFNKIIDKLFPDLVKWKGGK